MLNFRISVGGAFLLALTIGVVCQSTQAQLVEGNVLLLWNSRDDESSAIRDAYMLAHSGVVEFDLDIQYSEFPPNSVDNPQCADCSIETCSTCAVCAPGYNAECVCCSCPNEAQGGPPPNVKKAINKYYVTPEMFESHVRQPLLAFLENYAATHPEPQYEPILAIATTRGLPAVISSSFYAGINHSGQCIKGSFELHLAKLGFDLDTPVPNPYHRRIGRQFKWLFTPCGGQEYLKGKIYLVSRLDSDDGDEDGDYADDVVALIQRSTNLSVNKFGVTLVFDSNTQGYGTVANENDPQLAHYMQNRRWCVYYDNTEEFLHGQYHTELVGCGEVDPQVEGQYLQWPELAHITLGRNHRACVINGPTNCFEPVCIDYAREYRAHPAGLFQSLESWNGIGLRIPAWPGEGPGDPTDWVQGSVLHWIAAGGSFAVGRINGNSGVGTRYAMANLYQHGLSWGEAVWTELDFAATIYSNRVYTPIGDPLARVTVYDPDGDGNGIIDVVDVQFVMDGRHDVDEDGDVDLDDLDLVMEVYGRSAWVYPPIPGAGELTPTDAPASKCGDVNNDGAVNALDLALIDAYIDGTDCPGLDIIPDGTVNNADRSVVLVKMMLGPNSSWCIGDINEDGAVDENDQIALVFFLSIPSHNGRYPDNPEWAIYDIDCNELLSYRDDPLSLQQRRDLIGNECPE